MQASSSRKSGVEASSWPTKKRERSTECPALFLSELPEGGVAAHSGLAALAAVIDEEETEPDPKKRRGEMQVGLALL